MQRESMEFDVVIVGAGPAGLACAIHLMQCHPQLSICILEKAAQIGGHILSGAVFEPNTLTKLLPNWKNEFTEITAVTKEHFFWLTKSVAIPLPTLKTLNNQGNFIVSLGKLCQWLASQAEALGVHVFPGFAASKILYHDDGAVIGVQTDDKGLDKKGEPTPQFQAGINCFAKQTILAEGARGYLSEQLILQFNLRAECDSQSYGIGLKEIWQVDSAQLKPGLCIHTVGWPLDNHTYGGSFIYHTHQQIQIGFVVGLDYANPYLDPFQEFQRFKCHPRVRPLLENGTCIAYGSRALNEGGWQAIPKLVFPGGLLIGDSAGFLNVGKIKGIHNAIDSGMLAAKSLSETLTPKSECHVYINRIKQSNLFSELKQVRNIRPAFHKGLWFGLFYSAFDQMVLKGNAPWTWHYREDYKQLKLANKFQPIDYPKPDCRVSFDRLTQLSRSGVLHNEKQPCHLHLKDPQVAIDINWKHYAGPEQRYCPANVYEFIKFNDTVKLQINFANCLHCKTCDIKDPTQNIIWMTPEGGDGPNYSGM